MMGAAERKFQILMKEWEQVETHLHRATESRYRIRTWAITVFSGLFALSMYQDQKELLLIAAIVVFMFWTMDAMQNVLLTVCIRREHKIEEMLEDPIDEKLIKAKSPAFGRTFNESRNDIGTFHKYFDRLLIVLYGSMYAVLLVALVLV